MSPILEFPFTCEISPYKTNKHEVDHFVHIFLGTYDKYDLLHNDIFVHRLEDGNVIKHDFQFFNSIDPESSICIDLYATTKNYRDTPVIKRIGTLTLPLRQVDGSVQKMMHNASGTHKADVTISSKLAFDNVRKFMIGAPIDIDKTHRLIEDSIKNDLKETNKHIVGYNSFMKHIRLPPFQSRTIPLPGVSFWDLKSFDFDDDVLSQWLTSVLFRYNISLDEFSDLSDDKIAGQILGSVCSLYANSCTYVSDFIWNGDSQKVIESYESIAETNSGDCEDLSAAIMVVFNKINQRQIKRQINGPLDKLTDISHKYVCVASLAEVTKPSVTHNASEGQQAHMFSMLLPANHMKIHSVEHDIQPLVLEGTARVHPNIDMMIPKSFRSFMVYEPFRRLNYIKSMDFYKRIAHVYPSKPVNNQRTYGYSICNETSKGGKGVYGVRMTDFAAGNYRLWSHPEVTSETQIAVDRVMTFEHPSVALKTTKLNKHDEREVVDETDYFKFKLDKLVKPRTTGRRLIHDVFFVSIHDLSQRVVDRFVSSLIDSEIKLVEYSFNLEYGNVICVKLVTYDTIE